MKTKRTPGRKREMLYLWPGCPEFFDPDVQTALQKARLILKQNDQPAETVLIFFHAINRMAHRDHWPWESTQRKAAQLGRVLHTDTKAWMVATDAKNSFRHLYAKSPLAAAELLLPLTAFHAKHPREWHLGTKVMFLIQVFAKGREKQLAEKRLSRLFSDVAESRGKKASFDAAVNLKRFLTDKLKPNAAMMLPKTDDLTQLVKDFFGEVGKCAAEYCRTALTKEKQRRTEILARWESELAAFGNHKPRIYRND